MNHYSEADIKKLTNPYDGVPHAGSSNWLHGNLHAHTSSSDGKCTIQQVVDDYAQRGYGFIMISDHDIHISEQDYARCDPKGLIIIPGNEVTRDASHMLHVHSDRLIEPDADH